MIDRPLYTRYITLPCASARNDKMSSKRAVILVLAMIGVKGAWTGNEVAFCGLRHCFEGERARSITLSRPQGGRTFGRGLYMKLRHKEEVLGNNPQANIFVDRSCSNCGVCRSMCPGVFEPQGLRSMVTRDPIREDEKIAAYQAMVSCPNGAIRLRAPDPMVKEVVQRHFPIPLDPESLPNVYHLGYHQRESSSMPYLIVRPEGNIMIDLPRFNGRLAAQIDALGGVAYMIITHMSAADQHDYWQAYFPTCKRVVHRFDRRRDLFDAEVVLNGRGPWTLSKDINIVHLPGQTLGSIGVIYTPPEAGAEPVLFSGKALGWSRDLGMLDGFSQFTEVSMKKQADAIRSLAGERFTWILPAHGSRYRFANPDNKADILFEAADRFLERGRQPALL